MFTFSITFGPYRLSYFAYLIRNIVFKLLITIIKFSRPHFLKPFPSLSSRYNLLSSFVQKLHNRRFLLMFHFFFFSSETCQYFLHKIQSQVVETRKASQSMNLTKNKLSVLFRQRLKWRQDMMTVFSASGIFIHLLIQFFLINQFTLRKRLEVGNGHLITNHLLSHQV